MNYVKVVNGQVNTDPAPLPKNYTFADGSQTGNFDLMDANVIKAEGFLPVVLNYPAFDGRYQQLSFSDYTVGVDNVIANYIVVDNSLESVKQDKINEVYAKKNVALYGGNITYNTHVFASDRDSLQSIAISAFSASQVGASWSSPWPLADGSYMTLGQADIIGLNNAVNTRVLSLRSQAESAINAIKALTTQLDVVNYTISIA